jgi:hypothetical protein
MSLSPFEKEIQTFSGELRFVPIDFSKEPLSPSSHHGSETPWRREAMAHNSLILGVTGVFPRPRDLIMLSDIDDIYLPTTVTLIRSAPLEKYYDLRGVTYYYSFRWMVGLWFHPVIVWYGQFAGALDDYRDRPGVCKFTGTITVAAVFRQLVR